MMAPLINGAAHPIPFRPNAQRWLRSSVLFGIAISHEPERKNRSRRIVARLSAADVEFIFARLKETLTILSRQIQAFRDASREANSGETPANKFTPKKIAPSAAVARRNVCRTNKR
jgi:hypothetical protein